ncbi:MAG: restriction endonuclease [Acidimicrobiales bacterium]
MDELDPYEILGVSRDASKEDIRKAFLRLSRQVHSDTGGTDGLFRQVKWAYDVLCDSHEPQSHNKEDDRQYGGKDERSDWDQTADREGDEETSANASTRLWARSHPAELILLCGVLVTVVGTRIGSSLALLGVFIGIVGLAGVMGIRRAREVEYLRRANIGSIDLMSGQTFERFLVTLFESEGYGVEHVGGRGDFGADLILLMSDVRTVVQSKRYGKTVGPSAIQEVAAARAHYRAHEAMVVTNSIFTPAAMELARSNHVKLLDRWDLIERLATQSSLPALQGSALFRRQLRYGLPILLKRLFILFTVILVSLFGLVSELLRTGKKRRR